MTDQKRCPECDTPIPENAPEGMCPRCLLEGGLEREVGDATRDGNTHVENSESDSRISKSLIGTKVGRIRIVGHESKGRINKRLRIQIEPA